MTIMFASSSTRRTTRVRVSRTALVGRHARLRREYARLTHELTEARFEATHDALTGLLNRAGLIQAWPALRPTGLLLIDLDDFKPVNDRFGHLAGDLVLGVVGGRLTKAAGVVARLGGDEFVLVTGDMDPIGFAHWVAGLIGAPIDLPDGRTVTVSASIGVRLVTGPIEVYRAVEDADRAMYAAKADSTTGVVVFTPDLPSVSDSGRRRDARQSREALDSDDQTTEAIR